jgi:hypothetical protein
MAVRGLGSAAGAGHEPASAPSSAQSAARDAHRPVPHQPRPDVRVALGEGARGASVLALKEQDRAVDGFGERAGEHQLAAPLRLPCQAQMLGAVRRPPLEVIRYEIVDEQKVHDASASAPEGLRD